MLAYLKDKQTRGTVELLAADDDHLATISEKLVGIDRASKS
jgi:hypothetical protein